MTSRDVTGETQIREHLSARLTDIEAEIAAGKDATATVALDQQAVGRLSRMDALQARAMARAAQARRAGEARRLRAALARLEEGEYGWCAECGEDIAAERLARDPAIALCLACARGG